MNPARVVIPIAESLVEEENSFNFCDDYQNLQRSTSWKPNVLKVTSMWKFSFCEHLPFLDWSMNELEFYPQVQILHKCIIFSLWVEPINFGITTTTSFKDIQVGIKTNLTYGSYLNMDWTWIWATRTFLENEINVHQIIHFNLCTKFQEIE
jgi:hypothetical protein